MAEYLIRANGGPNPGTRQAPSDWEWPLPETLLGSEPGGYYKKIRESQLPASVDENPHVSRGAEYEWVSDE